MAKQSMIESRTRDITDLALDTPPQTAMAGMPTGEMNAAATGGDGDLEGMPGGAMSISGAFGKGEVSTSEMPIGAMSGVGANAMDELAPGDMPMGAMINPSIATVAAEEGEMPRGDMRAGDEGSPEKAFEETAGLEVSGAWRLVLMPTAIKSLTGAKG